MKLYYLTVEGITSTVFDSQVSGLVTCLNRKGWQINLLIGQKYRSRISVLKFLSLFLKNYINFIFIGPTVNHKRVADKIARKLQNSTSVILHCRNVEAAYIGLLVKDKATVPLQLIYDVRGYVEQEKAFFNEHDRELLFKSLNEELFKADIYFSFVSKELYELYNSKYKIPLNKVIFCNSGYNDSVFTAPIESVSEPNSLIKILFVGGNQPYQKTEEIILALGGKVGIELTVVTPKPLLMDKGYHNIKLLNNLSQSDINSLANDFDYGIIYRSSKLFNEVATPTKVSEYLGKGLKVIAINSAGAYSKIISENKTLGFLVKSEEELRQLSLKKVTFDEKRIISEYARQNFSLSRNVDRYIALYERINEGF